MREIVLDTETTGMEPADGHRLIEIGAVELVNHIPTGRHYHQYIHPERDVPADAVAVHGLTEAFLKDKPVFAEVFADFLEFIGDDMLVIHNAEFDIKFLNHELRAVGHTGLSMKRVTDSLALARRKFPGAPASLDALCRRYNIDLSGRELHGALLDSELLAEVYLELLGGRQQGLGLAADTGGASATGPADLSVPQEKPYREPRPHAPSEEEEKAHAALVAELANPLWETVKG